MNLLQEDGSSRRAGKDCFTAARWRSEKLALEEFFRKRRALKDLEGRVLSVAGIVKTPGNHLFSGSKFAFEKNRRVVVRDLLDHFQNFFHFGALSDHAGARHRDGCSLEAAGDFSFIGGLLQTELYRSLEVSQFKRLREIIEGSESHCLNRRFNRTVPGHHNNLRLRVMLFGVTNDIEAVHVTDEKVDDHEIGLGGIERLESVSPGLDGSDIVSLLPTGLRHQVQDCCFVVDDEDIGHGQLTGGFLKRLSNSNTTVFLTIATKNSHK